MRFQPRWPAAASSPLRDRVNVTQLAAEKHSACLSRSTSGSKPPSGRDTFKTKATGGHLATQHLGRMLQCSSPCMLSTAQYRPGCENTLVLCNPQALHNLPVNATCQAFQTVSLC